jgi:hypothetical protein
MGNKKIITTVLILLLLGIFCFNENTYAQGESFESICQKVKNDNDPVYGKYPDCASSPAKCASQVKDGIDYTPLNCLFLEEPIGGENGYDLYKITCKPTPKPVEGTQSGTAAPGGITCAYELWYGAPIIGENERGPVQAILSYEEDKQYQGPLGLLYNYLGLIYKFMSGIIVGFVILTTIVGGIIMTTSSGNQTEFDKGKSMIQKAVIGMIIWFLASLILYTINPTFFAF